MEEAYNVGEGKSLNYQQAWNIFEQTGNVDAYLLYKQLKSEEQKRERSEEMSEDRAPRDGYDG